MGLESVTVPGKSVEVTPERYYEIVEQAYKRVREEDFDVAKYLEGESESLKKAQGVGQRREVFVRVSETLENLLTMVDDPEKVPEYESLKKTLQQMDPQQKQLCRDCLRVSESIATDVLPQKELHSSVLIAAQLIALLA